MKRSKRLLSLILSIMMVISILPGNVFAAAPAQQANTLSIKVNVFDWDEKVQNGTDVPVPNVNIGISRVCVVNGNTYTSGTTDNFIVLPPSDEDGTACADSRIVNMGNGRSVIYLNGIQNTAYTMFDGWAAWPAQLYFQFKSASSGYSIDYNSEYSVQWIDGVQGLLDPFTPTERVAALTASDASQRLASNPAPYGDFFSFHNESADQGASGEFNIYVKADKVSVSYENYLAKNWDDADYPSQRVKAGTVISAPSKTPVSSINDDIEFLGWADKKTGELFDFAKPVASDVTLVPKWGPNPYIAGYVHLDSFLWDHDANNGSYGSGQTDTTVNDLKYIVEYYDQAVATTTAWHKLCEVTVDENGQADFVITSDMLAELKAFNDSIKNLPPENNQTHHVAIDIGPDTEDQGWHTTAAELNNYAWDWIMYNKVYEHGAGVTGVRTMAVNIDAGTYNIVRDDNTWRQGKNGESTSPTVGNVQYATNVNHVPWMTDDMLENGFEIWWKVYVTPSMVVRFDLDGGTGAGDYSDQNFEPINSLPGIEHQTEFKAVKPANDPAREQSENFVGWYKVIGKDENNKDILEGTPWDFANRLVTKSMTLKAVYADKIYTVVFDPANGQARQTNSYVVGDTPAWTGADPVSTDPLYEFDKWIETKGTNTGSDYFFKDEYDMDHTARAIYDDTSDTDPVSVTADFADVTVYTAQYKLKDYFYVVHHAVHGDLYGDDTVDAIPLSAIDDPDGYFDITVPLAGGEYAGIRKGYIYGGIYADNTFAAPDDADCGKELIPEAGKFFYLREVSEDFLQTKIITLRRYTSDTHFERYLLTAIDQDGADNEFYSEYGFIYNQDWDSDEIDGMMQSGNVYKDEDEEIYDESVDEDPETVDYENMTCILYEAIDIYVTKDGVETPVTYTPDSIFSANLNVTEDDYIGCVPYDSGCDDEGVKGNIEYTFHYAPYYVTADGVFVSGIKERYVGGLDQLTPVYADDEIGSVTYSMDNSTLLGRRNFKPMMVVSTFSANPNAVPETPAVPEIGAVTVTIHANGETSAVSAEPGDFTSLMEAPVFSGLRFAGWYADAAFTTAADLSNVKEDTDVYARYINDAYFTVQMINTTSKKVITKTRVVTVVDDRDLYREVGFEITVGGEKTVYTLNKDYASVNGYSPVKMYGSDVDKHSRLIYQDINLKTVSDGTTIEMTPYYITADGAKVLGDTRTVMYYSDHMESVGG